MNWKSYSFGAGVVGMLGVLLCTMLPFGQAQGSKKKLDPATIYGRIQIVQSFPDYKVKSVQSFPDVKIKLVKSLPGSGEWQIVKSHPDFKIQLVQSFPDFTVEFTNGEPGEGD